MSTNAIWFLCGAAVWVVTGLLAYALYLGAEVRERGYALRIQVVLAVWVGVWGPVGLLTIALALWFEEDPFTLRWWPRSRPRDIGAVK